MAASNTCSQNFELSFTSVIFEKNIIFIRYCHTKHQDIFALSNQFVNES